MPTLKVSKMKSIRTQTSKRIVKPKSVTKKIKEAPTDKAFWVNNGPVVKTLAELATALRSMSDVQYYFHTMRSGNDFSRWVKDVLGQSRCAAAILKAKTQREAAAIVESYQ